MSKAKRTIISSAGLVALGLLAGVVIAQVGSAAAGTGQQAVPAVNTDAPALDQLIPQGAFVKVAEETRPALVYITTEQTVTATAMLQEIPEIFRRFYGEDEEAPEDQIQASQGSGFLISSSGYIVTNGHVVSQVDPTGGTSFEVTEADRVTVRLFNEDEYDAEIIGVDIGTDLAVLKIDAGNDLPFIPMGNSDAAKVGEWVMALGAPFGLTNTVSAGIISAKGRAPFPGGNNPTQSPYQDFIQTDAAINRGNSGGPLVNLRGEVVGINTMIVSNGFQGQFAGVGFAIPIDLVSGVVDQLIEHGRTIRGWLGISMGPLPPGIADAYSLERRDVRGAVRISTVNEGEPSDLAGVREGDIVIGTGGRRLEGNQDFLQRIAVTPPDASISLDIIRLEPDNTTTGVDKTPMIIEVTLGERPPEAEVMASQTNPPLRQGPLPVERGALSDVELRLGLALTELTEEIGGALDYDIAEGGIVIYEMTPNGAADRGGLIPNTIIREVNLRPVNSVEEFEALVESFNPGDTMEIMVRFSNGVTVRNPFVVPDAQ